MAKQAKFAFVTAGSENYIPGLNTFFHSVEDNMEVPVDVILLSFRLPKKFLEKVKKFPFNTRVVEIEGDDQVQGTAIERFRVAAELGKEYEAICLMEGDLFLVADVSLFFKIAEAGFIITSSNGMIVNFGKDYQKQYNIDLGSDNYIYPKVHTTVPIFLGKKDLDWFEKFYEMRGSARSFDDVFGLNVLGISMGKNKRMITLAPFKFTGIHHFFLKPNTRAIEKDGQLLSETEEEIKMIHGKFWDKAWFDDLMKTMEGYFQDNHYGGLHRNRAKESQDLLLKEFIRYSHYSEDFPAPPWIAKKIEKKNWNL